MLTERFSREALRTMNLPVHEYHLFPIYVERDKWCVRPETTEVWLHAAEAYEQYEWPAITAEMYFALRETGQLRLHLGYCQEELFCNRKKPI